MKLGKATPILSMLLILLAACGPIQSMLAPASPSAAPLPSATPEPTQTPTPTRSPTHTSTPLPTRTATTQPSPSATSTPTASDPWGGFPGPSETSATQIPTPAVPIDFPPGSVNVMLLGSDKRPNVGGYRTDTLLLAALDPGLGQVTLFSIPRDLYVYLPGFGMGRINTAEPRGGFEMLNNTMRYNFGIPLDHWVRVRFEGLEQAVNLLGGLAVRSTGYLYDECGGTYYEYQPGQTYEMDGFTALCYVRMRKRSSDFDRLRRQQEVLLAMFDKVISIHGLERVPELYELFKITFSSDMTLEEVLDLVPLASKVALEPARIRLFRIEPSMAPGWRVPTSGAAVLLPDQDAIQSLLREAFPY